MPRCSTPGPAPGPRARGGTGRAPRSSPRRSGAFNYLQQRCGSRGNRQPARGRGDGDLPSVRVPLGAFPSRTPGERCGAGAAPGALPQLRRAGASRAHPAGTGIAGLGDRRACDSGKFCSGRAAGRAVRTAGLRRFSAAGPCGSPAPRVFPLRWPRMLPDPCRAERALTTKELRFLLFSRGLVRM